MDVERIRRDFPVLSRNDQPFIYFDNGATAQKPAAVISRMSRFYEQENANIHRGSYPLSNQASTMYEGARETVREWIDAEHGDEVVFTKSCTESVNLVAAAVFETWIHPGDNVIVTELEHSSNYFPWKHYCERGGAEFRKAVAESDGYLRTEAVLSLIDERTKLITITVMSNVTGIQPDLETIIAKAHEHNALVMLDAAQAIVHQILSVRQLQCDFLCFSGHKIYGPMGIGVLYGKRKYLEAMAPYLYGGDMVMKGEGDTFTYKEAAGKYEAGTQNIAGALGLEAALIYLKQHEFGELLTYEMMLAAHLKKRLEVIKGIRIIGSGSASVSPVLVFEAEQLGAYDVAVLLANRGIAVRCGAFCSYPLMRRLGKESLCRISLAFYNTIQEIDYVADTLEHICGRWDLWNSMI